jgi:hypothetical protein
MTALQEILDGYRSAALSEREKGTYFEELILCYLRNEATYRDLYSEVWTYADWAAQQGLDKRDAGIDLVARTAGTNDIHAIQCKLYAADYRLQKADIDSFFTASGKKPFTHRVIVSSTNHWTEHAEDALRDQQPPVSKIDLFDLENSQIDWARYKPKAAPALKPKKTLREHQTTAVAKVISGLAQADRGKLIMACGTGKTFTSLKIAEALAGMGGRVLFLVPSLSLLSQSLTEWTQESTTPLHSFAVCSDSDVGKKRKKEDDAVQTFTHELRYPATTEPKRLAAEVCKRHDAQHMSVVFSTYHSIDVISQAQQGHGLADFDLIICDEAQRRPAVPGHAGGSWPVTPIRGHGPGPQTLGIGCPHPRHLQGCLRGGGPALLQPTQPAQHAGATGPDDLQDPRGLQGLESEPRARGRADHVLQLRQRGAEPAGRDHQRPCQPASGGRNSGRRDRSGPATQLRTAGRRAAVMGSPSPRMSKFMSKWKDRNVRTQCSCGLQRVFYLLHR